jgi:hypothetical protein
MFLTTLERFHQLGALFVHGGFHHGAAAQHHVVALAVELDDLEFQGLVLVGGEVLGGTAVDQRARQEGADAVDHDLQAALDLAGGGAGDELARFESFFEGHPRGQALGLVAREQRVAEAVLDRVDGHGDEVADLHFEFALVILEFGQRNVGFRLQAGVDHHVVVFDANDLCGDDLTRAHFGALEGLFEEGGKRFRHWVS